MQPHFTDLEKYRNRFLAEKKPHWTLFCTERPTRTPKPSDIVATYADSEDLEQSWAELEGELAEKMDQGFWCIVRVYHPGKRNHAVTATLQHPDFVQQERTNGINGLSRVSRGGDGLAGIYGTANIRGIVDGEIERAMQLRDLEDENDALRAEVEQLRRGEGVTGFANTILQKIPEDQIGTIAGAFADRILGAIFPTGQPVALNGFDEDERRTHRQQPPRQQPPRQQPPAPQGEAQYPQNRTLAALEGVRAAIGGDVNDVLTLLEKLPQFKKSSPSVFNMAIQSIKNG